MKTIWKFPLPEPMSPELVHEMPDGAEIIRVAMAPEGTPAMWAIVDPDAPKIARRFMAVGTGHSLGSGDHVKYLGSLNDRIWVWHYFEVTS